MLRALPMKPSHVDARGAIPRNLPHTSPTPYTVSLHSPIRHSVSRTWNHSRIKSLGENRHDDFSCSLCCAGYQETLGNRDIRPWLGRYGRWLVSFMTPRPFHQPHDLFKGWVSPRTGDVGASLSTSRQASCSHLIRGIEVDERPKFIFPNAPTIPITVVRTASA